ncbi:MAG TPA: helix-turn-helix domain-containing protein [Acidimicrobiia bacterium]|nr:helix-turn-helix domain-containing protein [Acidimicrobiia bacterium]
MPRDATETRNRLLREAERLFATRGIWRTTTREILDAAGQRNVSALSYHFGSRAGVLREILLRHGDPLDDERGELLARAGGDAGTRELVASLLVPLAGRLATPDGRDYLRIVAQLTEEFPAWRIESDLTPPNLRHILGLLEARPAAVAPEVRRERVVLVIMLMTSAMAERARALDAEAAAAADAELELDEAAFVANLTDVIVAALEAPSSLQTLTGVGRRGSSPAAR